METKVTIQQDSKHKPTALENIVAENERLKEVYSALKAEYDRQTAENAELKTQLENCRKETAMEVLKMRRINKPPQQPCVICKDHKSCKPFMIRSDNGVLFSVTHIVHCPFCGRFLSENYDVRDVEGEE